ncbi:MAG: hypothetical protein KGL95_10295, partial [Patescibacteria group bacterium]|nr:hypothetical protein [Patescibacteria group bacterium]
MTTDWKFKIESPCLNLEDSFKTESNTWIETEEYYMVGGISPIKAFQNFFQMKYPNLIIKYIIPSFDDYTILYEKDGKLLKGKLSLTKY